MAANFLFRRSQRPETPKDNLDSTNEIIEDTPEQVARIRTKKMSSKLHRESRASGRLSTPVALSRRQPGGRWRVPERRWTSVSQPTAESRPERSCLSWSPPGSSSKLPPQIDAAPCPPALAGGASQAPPAALDEAALSPPSPD